MRKSDFFLLTIQVPAYHELRFDAMLCSNMANENFDAGQIKCSGGPAEGSPPLH